VQQHNYEGNNGKDNDEEKDQMKRHDSRGDKGNNNSRSMAGLLAEICRGSEDNIQERSTADDPSSDKTARNAHVSNSGSKRQMQEQASEATSEEDNDDNAPDAANDDDNEADAASSDQTSVDDDIARTERMLRLYFSSLARTGTIRTVEEEFTLVTAKLNLVKKKKKKKLNVYSVISLRLLRTKKTHTGAVKLCLIQIRGWDRISPEMAVAGYAVRLLGGTEILIAASHNLGFGRELFLKRGGLPYRARLGPEDSSRIHLNRIWGRWR